MKRIECWACGCMATVGKTCACGHFVTDHCDAYVYDSEEGPADVHRRVRRWYWKCHHCGAADGPFRRRMDADEAAGIHTFGEGKG